MSDTTSVSPTQLRPKSVRNVVRLMTTTYLATFIWGSPGISKSAVAKQIATEQGIAFVDVRLSMMAPTDVSGMPYRIEENGETVGVGFTPPKILPRNLALRKTKTIEAMPTFVSFEASNPLGSNDIRYVTDVKIEVKAINRPGTAPEDMLTAEIVEQSLTDFTVALVNAKGEYSSGQVFYHITGDAKALVAFEELNSAPLATQQAAYQFILDRRVGEYIVPDGVRLIAMGNRQTDKGLTFTMPSPLANRFDHIEMVVNFDDWQEWAIGAMVHPHVIGYLTDNAIDLDQFNAQNASRGFATPRSWTAVSTILQAQEAAGEDRKLSPKELLAVICGAIGDGTGVKFNTFRKLIDKLPSIADIMAGRVTTLPKEDGENPALAYSLTVSLCYALRMENDRLDAEGKSVADTGAEREAWYKGFNNILDFWMKNFAPEVQVMGMRTILTIHKLPVKNRAKLPSLITFTKLNSDLIR
jgi:hypothetical protein